MRIKDKIKLYYPDFLFQSVVFYIAVISSLGVLPYYLMGEDTESILWHELSKLRWRFTSSRLFKTIFNIFAWWPLTIVVRSAPLFFANIYILRINSYKLTNFNKFNTKIIFMLIAVVSYFLYILIANNANYHEVFFTLFPAFLTSLAYFFYVRYKEQKNSRKEAS